MSQRVGQLLSSLLPTALQSVRVNAAGTAWETFEPMDRTVYDTDNDGVVDNAERIEITVRVRSSDYPSGLTKGTVVYIGGATGNRPYVLKADASLESTSSKTLGVLTEDIAANADGQCAVNGTLHNLALPTSTYTDGDSLWLSETAGEFQINTPPAEPAHQVFIGWVVRAHPTQGRLVLHIQNGYELHEIHGVLLDSPPADGDVLTYETSSGLWKNKPAGGGGGVAVLNVNTTDTTVTNATTDTHSYTIAAGKLDSNGDTIRATYAGQMDFAGADTLSISLRFGDASLGGFAFDSTVLGDWEMTATITRTSSTAAKVRLVMTYGANGSEVAYFNRTTGIDWTGTEAIALRIQSNGATASATTRMSTVEFLPSA